jgi:hypothetical protein
MVDPLRSRCVALVTRDPTLYAELAQVLRERRIPTVSLLPGQRIPAHVAVVLTSESEASSIGHAHVVTAHEDGDRAAFWAAVNNALQPTNAESELVVGIDPGPRPGYAVVSEGVCLAQGTLDSPEATARFGSHLRRRFPGRALRFRVGGGDRASRDRILNALEPLRKPIEIVDEQGTTPRGRRRPRDAVAARAIAEVPGPMFRGLAKLTFTPGEVANLQRLSREGSGGQFTISRSQAGRVLRGEISFGDALAEAERRYVPAKHRISPSISPREVS